MFKINLFCAMCHEDALENKVTMSELNESEIYNFKCSNGHDTSITLTNFKFEILFQIGAHAINDGYYREAISSFSSAVERAYEAITKIMLLRAEVSYAEILNFWKTVSKQSERQLGAYLSIYLATMKSTPPTMPQKLTEFRNLVIHNGRLPTREEALDYGQKSLDLIRQLTAIMRNNFDDEANKYQFYTIKEKKWQGKYRVSTTIDSIINWQLADEDFQKIPLEVALTSMQNYVEN